MGTPIELNQPPTPYTPDDLKLHNQRVLKVLLHECAYVGVLAGPGLWLDSLITSTGGAVSRPKDSTNNRSQANIPNTKKVIGQSLCSIQKKDQTKNRQTCCSRELTPSKHLEEHTQASRLSTNRCPIVYWHLLRGTNSDW